MRTFFELMRHWVLAMVFHVAPRFANVLVFIFIGRLAGPDQAGVFSLATTYLLIITTITRGLDDLLIRQVGREPGRAANYFGNFLLLRLVLAGGLYVALVFFLQHGPDYPPATVAAIVILTLSVVPDSLGFVAQSIMLGNRRFGTPAAALSTANLFKVVAGGIVLLSGGDLMLIAWLWVIGSSLGMIALLVPAFRQVGGVRHANWLNFSPLRSHWQAAVTFCAITSLTALDSQIDTVLLSVFRDEADVGWYNAATTITFSLLMLSQAYRFAVYPLMVRYAKDDPAKLEAVFQKSVYYMGVVSLPMVAGLIVLAPDIVNLIFGAKFAPTVPVLQVLAISLVFFFMGEPCNRLMLVKDRHQVLVRMLAFSTAVNIILNLLLIPRIGTLGASVSRTCSSLLFFLLNYNYVSLRIFPDLKMKSMFRPLFSALVMAGVVFYLGSDYIIVSILTGMIIYFATLWIVKGILPSDADVIRRISSTQFSRIVARVKT